MNTLDYKYIICIESYTMSKKGIIEVGEKYYTFNFDNSTPKNKASLTYYVFDIESNLCLGSFYKKYFMDLDEYRNNKINKILLYETSLEV